jgi:hypothetical protein
VPGQLVRVEVLDVVARGGGGLLRVDPRERVVPARQQTLGHLAKAV